MIHKNLTIVGCKIDSLGRVLEARGTVIIRRNLAKELGIEGVC